MRSPHLDRFLELCACTGAMRSGTNMWQLDRVTRSEVAVQLVLVGSELIQWSSSDIEDEVPVARISNVSVEPPNSDSADDLWGLHIAFDREMGGGVQLLCDSHDCETWATGLRLLLHTKRPPASGRPSLLDIDTTQRAEEATDDEDSPPQFGRSPKCEESNLESQRHLRDREVERLKAIVATGEKLIATQQSTIETMAALLSATARQL